MSYRTVTELEAWKIRAIGAERDVSMRDIEIARLHAQIAQLTAKEKHHELREAYKDAELDPDQHAVVTTHGGPWPMKTVLDLSAKEPVEEEELRAPSNGAEAHGSAS